VTSGPANRTALREEENRSAPLSQHVIASAVTGPAPYSRAASTWAPVRCRAASSSWCRTACIRVSSASSTSRAVVSCSCPAGDRQPPAACSAARPCLVRSVPPARAAAPWWNSTAQLRPGGVLGPQIVIGLQQRPGLQDPGGRDPALRQPALGQQHPQMPGVGLVGPGVPLAAAGKRGIGRPGQMRRDAGRGQFLRDIPPPGAPPGRERDVIAAVEPGQPGPQVLPVRRGDLAAAHLPGLGAGVAEGDLLPVDIQPAYDGHWDLLKLRRARARAPCELLRGQS
jgi:hypothetical protein